MGEPRLNSDPRARMSTEVYRGGGGRGGIIRPCGCKQRICGRTVKNEKEDYLPSKIEAEWIDPKGLEGNLTIDRGGYLKYHSRSKVHFK